MTLLHSSFTRVEKSSTHEFHRLHRQTDHEKSDASEVGTCSHQPPSFLPSLPPHFFTIFTKHFWCAVAAACATLLERLACIRLFSGQDFEARRMKWRQRRTFMHFYDGLKHSRYNQSLR
ncbi:hypothetical protein GOP47_0010646 [Adiantum capillus-veneris]|uniref:Uncharacterized protein n=1 Tax=Adiantum capillus-veneris TaxID=13818 RepID=A0A9D4UUX8_ADICA|nr:hypothetical protein GOP47_0010646 [Adiantum capillus-veneris]